MVAQQRQPLRIELVNAPRALTAVAHQACVLEDAKVLGDGGARDGQTGRKLVHGLGMVAEHLEDGEAGGVAQSGKTVLYVSVHLR